MKYSRTALRELTRLYRVALLAAIMGTVAVSGTARAEGGITVSTDTAYEGQSVSNEEYHKDDVTSRTNNQSYGGYTFVDRPATLTVTDSNYSGLVFDGSGTVLSNRVPSGDSKATINVSGTTFTGNHSYGDGGAIANFNQLSITDSVFTGNTSQMTKDGSGNYTIARTDDTKPVGGGALALGAVSATNVDVTSISNTTFENNKSGVSGGAIGTRLGKDGDNHGAKLDITATFTGNEAVKDGGAIYNTFYADNGSSKGDGVTVKGIFSGNTAGVNGGAIFNDGAKDVAANDGGVMTLTDSEFTGNTAGEKGGAIYNTGTLTVAAANADVTFSGNKANGVDNDIYNTGSLTLNAAEGKSILLAGGIDGDSANKGTTNISGAGSVKVANALKNQNVTNDGNLQLDGANLDGTTIGGEGTVKVVGDSEVQGETVINQDVAVESGQTLEVVNAEISGTGDLNNAAGGILKITDSEIHVDVNNAGTLISDPTTYYGTVSNTGVASFDHDTFESSAELANSAVANLSNDVTFVAGAKITGTGTTNLVGGTTHFNSTASSNTMNIANGADFDGTLVNTGVVNTQNGSIGAVTGVVNGGKVAIDVNAETATGTADTFGSGTSATISSLNVLGGYGTAETSTITATGLSIDSNTAINGGYFTKVEQDGDNLVFSDKLLNTSSFYDKVGTWTGGNYIAANADMDHPADGTDYLSVGQALAAVDAGMGAKIAADGNYIKESGTNSVNANITALDTAIGDMSGFATQNYAKITTDVASNLTALDTQVKANAGDIGDINTAITVTADGTYIKAAKTAAENLGLLDTQVKQNADDIATKQDALTAGNGIEINAGTKTISVKADGTKGIVATSDGVGIDAGSTIQFNGGKLDVKYASMFEATSSDGLRVKDGGITATQLASDAVTTTKIADGNVTANKLAADSVTTVKIANGAVTLAKLGDDVIATEAASGSGKLITSGAVYDLLNVASPGTYISTGTGVGGNLAALDAAIGAKVSDGSRTTGKMLADNSVNANLTALDTAIGGDVTSTNYVAAANSINANISALDVQVKINANDIDTLKTSVTTQTKKADTIGTAIGGVFDTDGTFTHTAFTSTNNIGSTDNLTTAISSLDSAIGSIATAKTAVAGASTLTDLSSIVAQLSDNLTNGTVDAVFKDTTVSSLAIAGTDYKITSGGAATLKSVDAETVTTDSLKLGDASAITVDTSGNIDMGANNLTNIASLTTGALTVTDGTAANTFALTGKTINVDGSDKNVLNANGDVFSEGIVAAADGLIVAKKTAADTYSVVFDVDDNGSIASDMLTTDNTNNTVQIGKNADSSLNVLGSLKLNSGTQTVSAIDDGATAKTTASENNATTMATVATVLKSAENATYTNGIATGSNITGVTLGTAIGNLDAAIGNRTIESANAAVNTALATDVSTAIKQVGDEIGTQAYVNNAAVNYAAITANTDLTTAVSQVASNIGAAANAAKGNIAAANTVNANLDSLDAAIGNRTIESANTAVNTALATDVSTAIKQVGDEIGTQTYVNNAAVNYGVITANTDLTTAVSQVASNVGTAITGQTRTVAGATTAAGNTINANINALDKAIGGDVTGQTRTVTGGSTAAANSITANINALDIAIGGDVVGQARTVTGGSTAAANSIKANIDALDATLGGDVEGANGNVSKNNTVAANLDAIDAAIGDINSIVGHYIPPESDVATSLTSLDSNLVRVESRVNRMDNEMRAGFAAAAAMAALVPNARAAGDTQISVGTGNYRDRVGFALGAFHYVNDNILVNAGAAYGGTRSATFKAGVTFGW